MGSKAYFDEVAHQWDQMRTTFFSEKVRETAYLAAGIQKGKQAADIGVGTGFVTEGLLANGLKVIAVDQSEAMLAELKRKFPDLDCRHGEAERLPIPDETVDYVFANMYLHHVERPLTAIREMTRILKYNGRLVITDLDTHNNAFLKEEHHDRWMGFERNDVSSWFEDSGLNEINVDSAGQDCCASSCNGSDSAKVSIFVASGTKR
jgi:ubiquinone/menaquinone biosynthesis C-methylase UbiE